MTTYNYLFINLVDNNNNGGCCNQLLCVAIGIVLAAQNNQDTVVVNDFVQCIYTKQKCSSKDVFDFTNLSAYTMMTFSVRIISLQEYIQETNIVPDSSSFFHPFGLIYSIDHIRMNDILQHLVFQSWLVDKANDFIINHVNSQLQSESHSKKKINVIHIRNERDMVEHYAREYKINYDSMYEIINNKYHEVILQYINPNEINIVLTYDIINNPVIDFMRIHGYNPIFTPKDTINGREFCAIIDLLVGKICNNIFLGNFSVSAFQGSTFSYVLLHSMSSDVHKVLIDFRQE